MIRPEEVYCIGKFTRTHGVQGEMAMSFTDDVFDRTDCPYLVCSMDGILVPFFIEEYRFKSDNVALIKFERIDTNEAAQDMMEALVRQMAQAEGVTEALKRRDQMAWVQRMNGIRSRAEEIVLSDLIYA